MTQIQRQENLPLTICPMRVKSPTSIPLENDEFPGGLNSSSTRNKFTETLVSNCGP